VRSTFTSGTVNVRIGVNRMALVIQGSKGRTTKGLANWCDRDPVPHFLVPQHLRCMRNGRLVIPARTLFCRGRNAKLHDSGGDTAAAAPTAHC